RCACRSRTGVPLARLARGGEWVGRRATQDNSCSGNDCEGVANRGVGFPCCTFGPPLLRRSFRLVAKSHFRNGGANLPVCRGAQRGAASALTERRYSFERAARNPNVPIANGPFKHSKCACSGGL